jgi:hypothetical protein
MPFFLGARRISQLAIDGDKDFSGRALLNVRLSGAILSGTVSGSPAWASAQSFPSPLAVGNLVLSGTGLTFSRTFTFPDLADTVVTLTAAQTLSNKTLSAPVFSGTITGNYTLGGTPTLASDLAISGVRTVGGTLTVDSANLRIGIGTTAPETTLTVGRAGNQLYPIGGGGHAYNSLALVPRGVVGNSRAVISVSTPGGSDTQPVLTFGGGYEGQYGTSFEVRTDIMGAGLAGMGFENLGRALVVKRLSQDGTTSTAKAILQTERISPLGSAIEIGPQTGSPVVYVSNTGNVGIGTTAPSRRLHVVGDVQVFDGNIFVNRTGETGNYFTSYRGGSLTVGFDQTNNIAYLDTMSTDKPLVFKTAGTERMRITGSTGNVGIGTTAPSRRLHVVGDVQVFDGNIFVNRTGETGNYFTSYRGGSLTVGFDQTNNIAYLDTMSTDKPLVFKTAGTERMRITGSTGNVGIGTTAPSQKLTVAGNVGIQAGANAFIGTLDNYALSLRTNNTDRVFIDSSGNVGIGTTAPEAGFKLDVVGSAVIRGNIMPNADMQGAIGNTFRRWASVRAFSVYGGDFVFENGWRLTEWGEGIALIRPDGSVAASWN